MTIPRTYNVPREQTTYLKHPLEISQSRVLVYTPSGRLIRSVGSVSSARRVVRAARKVAA